MSLFSYYVAGYLWTDPVCSQTRRAVIYSHSGAGQATYHLPASHKAVLTLITYSNIQRFMKQVTSGLHAIK